MSNLPPPQPLDVVAWVTVRLHANGGISTQGTIGDKKMALHLLAQATDAIKRQIPDEKSIIIPGRDVSVMPGIATRDMGDIPIGERGDP